MPKLSEEHLGWLCDNIPDPVKSPLGGRPPHDKRQAIGGIFWILDHGAKWKELPKEFGPKSTVHRWFRRWVEAGVFELLMRAAGACVQEQGGFRLYECFIDGTFCKARGGGDGIGATKAGKRRQNHDPGRCQRLASLGLHRLCFSTREHAGARTLHFHAQQ